MNKLNKTQRNVLFKALPDVIIVYAVLWRLERRFFKEKEVVKKRLGKIVFAPGESKLFPSSLSPYKWSMLDSSGNAVGIGNYDVTGGFYYPVGDYYDYTKVSVPIEIVPEPATFLLLCGALLIIRAFTRRKGD
ncbi:MAG: hypothetical protein PHP01_01365 [Phycisphaerae bacterium]|nr:hypothetical protein [Phycisphaerae bacterium]